MKIILTEDQVELIVKSLNFLSDTIAEDVDERDQLRANFLAEQLIDLL